MQVSAKYIDEVVSVVLVWMNFSAAKISCYRL